jgi:serine/threonine protein phosphatase PrpC
VYRKEEEFDFFAVFDGHGGREASTFAYHHLHQVLEAKLVETGGNAVESLKVAFSETNAAMKEANVKGGTTALVTLILGHEMYIANAGDSRAVLCQDGKTARITVDHKPNVPGNFVCMDVLMRQRRT